VRKPVIAILAFIVSLSLLYPALVPMSRAFATAPSTVSAQVISVFDGDTIRVRLSTGVEETVRMIGIDTPEVARDGNPAEPFSAEATALAQTRLGGRTVFLEIGARSRDAFDRLLAYVWVEQPLNTTEAEIRAKMFQAEILLRGYAEILAIEPNIKYIGPFVNSFEREARTLRRGIWSLVAPTGMVVASLDLIAEVVTVTNQGSTSRDISRWVLFSDIGDQTYTFPRGTVVPAGGSIRVVSGSRATAGPGQLVWTRSYMWSNSGDLAVLRNNAGNVICRLWRAP